VPLVTYADTVVCDVDFAAAAIVVLLAELQFLSFWLLFLLQLQDVFLLLLLMLVLSLLLFVLLYTLLLLL
jgi:hypothetical protein